jgi:hypothetical protein
VQNGYCFEIKSITKHTHPTQKPITLSLHGKPIFKLTRAKLIYFYFLQSFISELEHPHKKRVIQYVFVSKLKKTEVVTFEIILSMTYKMAIKMLKLRIK